MTRALLIDQGGGLDTPLIINSIPTGAEESTVAASRLQETPEALAAPSLTDHMHAPASISMSKGKCAQRPVVPLPRTGLLPFQSSKKQPHPALPRASERS